MTTSTFNERNQHVAEIWQDNRWLYLLMGFGLGVLALPALQLINTNTVELLKGLVPEAVGIVFTVLIIERFARTRADKELKEQLYFELGSNEHGIAMRALRLLKHNGWIDKSSLQGADLSEANLKGAKLRGYDLSGATLDSTILENADLWGANVNGADLRWANVSGADLRSANVSGASLWSANLSDANLGGANLSGADLRSVNLSNASLGGGKSKRHCLETSESKQRVLMACESKRRRPV